MIIHRKKIVVIYYVFQFDVEVCRLYNDCTKGEANSTENSMFERVEIKVG